MKRIVSLCAIALMLASVSRAPAQEQGPPPGERPRNGMPRRERVDRVERLKQMRMIEELNLNEDDAVRFMAKRKGHEDRMRALTEDRNAMLDRLSAALKPDDAGKSAGTGTASVEKTVADVLDQDRKMFDERRRYQEEMRRMLPIGKYAKMLLFEREFQGQVRDAMKSMRKRSSKFDE